MDTILMLIKLLGGLAMFLYGMEIMSDGLKQGSGEALKKFLGKLTQNALLGVITGTKVTLSALGPDAEAAVNALDTLLQRDVY